MDYKYYYISYRLIVMYVRYCNIYTNSLVNVTQKSIAEIGFDVASVHNFIRRQVLSTENPYSTALLSALSCIRFPRLQAAFARSGKLSQI